MNGFNPIKMKALIYSIVDEEGTPKFGYYAEVEDIKGHREILAGGHETVKDEGDLEIPIILERAMFASCELLDLAMALRVPNTELIPLKLEQFLDGTLDQIEFYDELTARRYVEALVNCKEMHMNLNIRGMEYEDAAFVRRYLEAE